ncbi:MULTISPECIES: hypothetical protein [Antarcticibacterium]|nr:MULTISPECIES: hypothetical protein [Antarcticibacterium]
MGKNTSISPGEHSEVLIKALEIGEKSGFVDDFDAKENLAYLHRKHL